MFSPPEGCGAVHTGASRQPLSFRAPYASGYDESSGKAITTTECPECPGELVTESGETACTDCGLVVDRYWINHGPERRGFEDDHGGSPSSAVWTSSTTVHVSNRTLYRICAWSLEGV